MWADIETIDVNPDIWSRFYWICIEQKRGY
jgi:hypothetical protein